MPKNLTTPLNSIASAVLKLNIHLKGIAQSSSGFYLLVGVASNLRKHYPISCLALSNFMFVFRA